MNGEAPAPGAAWFSAPNVRSPTATSLSTSAIQHADGHIDDGTTDECPKFYINSQVELNSDQARELAALPVELEASILKRTCAVRNRRDRGHPARRSGPSETTSESTETTAGADPPTVGQNRLETSIDRRHQSLENERGKKGPNRGMDDSMLTWRGGRAARGMRVRELGEPYKVCAVWLSWLFVAALFLALLVALVAGLVWAFGSIVTPAGLS